jgi:hypothetical protein
VDMRYMRYEVMVQGVGLHCLQAVQAAMDR